MCIGLCSLWFHTRDRGCDLFRPLGPASCDITHETRGTNCFGHWVLRLVISHTRQGVRVLMGIGLCILRYHTRDRGYHSLRALGLCILKYHSLDRRYDLLRALGSASWDIAHETQGTICYGHSVCILWSYTRHRGTICYAHWVLHLVISFTAYELLRALGSASCEYHTRDKGTICYWHWVLRLVKSHTRQGVRCVTCIGSCILWYRLRKSGHYDLLRALGSASCHITHETGGTICYGNYALLLVISHTKQGVRLVTGIGFCILKYHTRARGYDLLRALGSASCNITYETGGTVFCEHCVLNLVISHTKQEVRFVTGIGICVSWYHTRDKGTSCHRHCVLLITHETAGTICYGHWVLRLVIFHTKQGVLFVKCIGLCILWYHKRNRGTTCYWHWVLPPVKSHTRQGVRFVTGVGSCTLWYRLRKSGVYDLLRALGSASCDITNETRSTICYGHWALDPVISHTRQGVQQAFGAASGNTTHETGG